MSSAVPFAPAPAGSGLKPIPGDAGLPMIGYTLQLMRNPLKVGRERYDRYGPISWASAFGLRMVSMVGPDANEFVLRNKGDLFSNHQGWDYFIGKFFHRGIMLLDFDEHRWHRKIMQQAFKTEVLRDYIVRMGPGISHALHDWREDDRFLFFPAIKQLTLDLATDVFMGQQLDDRANAINEAFVDTVRAGTAILRFNVPGGRWSKGLRGRRLLEDFFRRELPNKRNSDASDLFSVLCRAETEDGESFSDDDVVNHMIFLMMAAHDTTTITLCNMIYWLARHPEWQQRIREESLALGKTQLDYDDLQKMESASLAMKEALRLCSPVPSIPRRTVRDAEFQGHYIPAGTLVSISPFFTHFMPEYWNRPATFDPERFADDRREDKVHPYAWVPFGGGAHKCIGLHFAELQVKAVLHQLVQQFEWSVDADYRMPLDMTSLPVPKDKLPVRLRRRQAVR
ncbi:cytochrome P450 [Isoalcanivorax indicus]|uniref:cytochrome P450 n=1 Tax=Isoalcanivorax indicus TaxID=2202653 RepID=UPI000DB92573|nr:cytochrome P450 [Isoalcanivorax indicus]